MKPCCCGELQTTSPVAPSMGVVPADQFTCTSSLFAAINSARSWATSGLAVSTGRFESHVNTASDKQAAETSHGRYWVARAAVEPRLVGLARDTTVFVAS